LQHLSLPADVEQLVVVLGEGAPEFMHRRAWLEKRLRNRIHQLADGHALQRLMRFRTQLPKVNGPSVQGFCQSIAQGCERLGDLSEYISAHHQHLYRRPRADAEID